MWETFTLLVIFGVLVTAGLLFVNRSLYKDFEGKDPVVQVNNRLLVIPWTGTQLNKSVHCRACLQWSSLYL